ncbi:MAG: acyl-CoA dehydrogenase family protein [Proteobacteria bacterium]|jgi:alkylation response protein AidB-like acyl-CoA dehydrogenase|nr:acyl-CoA dehydrogenase family protein [Pseudomonadota bacterium]MDC1209683.1 acyl-CoA dehydrogenase family protein [Pseudomonadota bacterium]|tara:strand:- start:901 stop:2043 length:1143 start_codon:yes stop_codon:yes gene_type:complete
MNFEYNDEQMAIKEMAKNFAETELMPHASEWDQNEIFPIQTLKKAAQLGLAAIYVSEDHGGSGLNRLDAAIIFEELSRGCVSTAAYLSIHNMVTWMIDAHGSESIKKKFINKLSTMEIMSSYCLTESGSGSDAAALKTTASKKGNSHYILNGSKSFISGGPTSDVFAVMCRTGGEGPGGVSCLLVEKGVEGLSFGKQEKKMGWNSQHTSMVNFDNCQIPLENIVGNEGEGFKIAMQGLDGGRVNIAACSLGGARAALEASISYSAERKQFGKSIDQFQVTQFKLADMATELEASRLMVLRAASSLDAKDPQATKLCAMAKRFTTDICSNICDMGLQIHGGYGYLKDFPLERLVRDLRVHQILEGTNEIMRVIISRKLKGN